MGKPLWKLVVDWEGDIMQGAWLSGVRVCEDGGFGLACSATRNTCSLSSECGSARILVAVK